MRKPLQLELFADGVRAPLRVQSGYASNRTRSATFARGADLAHCKLCGDERVRLLDQR
jgi:hypothetical protein